MPQGTFSNKVQTAWDRVTRRRERRQPEQLVEVEAVPGRPQGRASRLTRAGSLPNLLDHASFNERPEWLPDDRQHPVDNNFSTNSSSLGSLSVRTAFRDEVGQDPTHREKLNVPVVAVATCYTGSSSDEDTPDPVWKLPGRDSFPDRQGQGQKLRLGLFQSPRQMYRVKASGRVFMIPIDGFLLHSNIPQVHGDVFSLLLDICVSPSGFVGHERGLSLPILLAALSYAFDQGITYEIQKLKDTINRYIALRMFYHNPHTNHSLGLGYFEYRSEEIYRSWISLSQDERLQSSLSLHDLVKLYVYMVPYKWWAQLVDEFNWDFMDNIQLAHDRIPGSPKNSFAEVFNGFFHRTRLGLHPWMEDTARSHASEDAAEERTTRPEQLRLNTPVLHPPVPMSDSSDSPERVFRHIRRETAVFPQAGSPTDFVERSV
ncbi:Ff.00g102740.m01.CDS01 [Fusarium sp. VM40]|nr:Ff.00g102740.m01.CDS01 [Fusarium sp. VM40]